MCGRITIVLASSYSSITQSLVFFLVFFAIDRVESDLFVVLFKSGHVFSGLGELAFFHAFSDVPVDESSLGVHKIELVVQSSPGLGDGGRVGQHADGAVDWGLVGSGNSGGFLVVDALAGGRLLGGRELVGSLWMMADGWYGPCE